MKCIRLHEQVIGQIHKNRLRFGQCFFACVIVTARFQEVCPVIRMDARTVAAQHALARKGSICPGTSTLSMAPFRMSHCVSSTTSPLVPVKE